MSALTSTGSMNGAETEFFPVITGHPQEQHFSLKYEFLSCTRKPSAVEGQSSSVADTQAKNFNKIFAISKECGVNLEEKVFEYEAGDYMLKYEISQSICQFREDHHGTFFGSANYPVCFIGSSFAVFIKIRQNQKEAVFVTSLCNCKYCLEPEESNELPFPGIKKFEFDAMAMKPVSLSVSLIQQKQGHEMRLTFYPGVTDQFDMYKASDVRNFRNVAYYCSVPLESLVIPPFKNIYELHSGQRCNQSPETISLGIKNIAIEIAYPVRTPHLVSDNDRMVSFCKKMFENEAHLDFEVVSKDDKVFRCHKAVLAARSSIFEAMLANKMFDEGKRKSIKLSEDAPATETLLKCIYFQDTDLDNLSFRDLVGTLKLAHLQGFMELVGPASHTLLGMISDLEWEDVEDLWNLYSFVRNVDTVEIVVQLKFAVVTALRRLIMQKTNKRVRLDDEDVDGSLTDAVQNRALAKDLVMDLFRLLDQNE